METSPQARAGTFGRNSRIADEAHFLHHRARRKGGKRQKNRILLARRQIGARKIFDEGALFLLTHVDI